MEEKVKISPFELCILVIFFSIGTSILMIPSSIATETKQDAWLSSILSIVICAGLAYFYFLCSRRLEKKSYLQYLESVYGKVLGKIIGLLYVFFFFFGIISLLYYFGIFTTTQMLPNTPIKVLYVLLTIPVILIVRAGLEVLARCGEILIFWTILLFILLVVFLLPEIDIENLKPSLEASLKDQTKAILIFLSHSGFPLIIFLMIFPKHINRQEQAKWSFINGSILGAGVVAIMISMCILVLGSSNTARQLYPSYALAKSISLFGIIERIEPLMAAIWLITIFFKTSIYFYVCVIGLAQIFEVKSYRFFAIPIGLLAIILTTVFYPNYEYRILWDSKNWISLSIIFGILIPLLTLIIDSLRRLLNKKTINPESK
ncbi:GerAB/ArcD/ProY family transporter [Lysinibacillus fusiformis]|uniref:GerAB/ArcD/ProY family transporter n=1 Tax=Lysinibacillus fusiformis TaxID=28031 RepID=UPI003BA1543F